MPPIPGNHEFKRNARAQETVTFTEVYALDVIHIITTNVGHAGAC